MNNPDPQSRSAATALFLSWRGGDRASLDRLLPLVYDQLAVIAHQALSLRREVLGDKHFETAASMILVARVRAVRGERAAAEPMMRDALAVTQAALGAGHPAIIAAQYALGQLLLDAGRPADAEPFLRQAAESRSARLPEGHWLRAETEAALRRAVALSGDVR